MNKSSALRDMYSYSLGSVCDISNDPQMSSYTNRHGAYASVFRAEHANLTGYTSAYGNTSTYVSSDVYQQRYDNGYPAVAVAITDVR